MKESCNVELSLFLPQKCGSTQFEVTIAYFNRVVVVFCNNTNMFYQIYNIKNTKTS